MTERERKQAAKSFVEYWKDKGYEKGQSQKFWIAFLRDILGVEKPETIIAFEETVKDKHTNFIDGWIESTKVLIEQKSSSVNLRSAIKQSDGSLLTPFQQALKYNNSRPYSKKARWIITCNFQEFLIYDMEKPTGEPESILLKDLPKEYYRLQFIVEQKSELLHKEEQVSIKAGELVGLLYDALLKQYNDKDEQELKSLNELCVRVIFCLYAEDSGLFGEKLAFRNYINSFSSKDLRRALIDLFKVLDTKIEDRDKYLDEDLAKFPYVNGGLFSNENIIIPQLTEEIKNIIIHNASEEFDWSEISPTIFGAVFESTLNPETRRSGGMHYTSIENIHKVIDPLFLNELNEELEEIKAIKVDKTRKQRVQEYRNKLASLNFLDPACGSGNFLTETYISLRRLENEAIKLVEGGQIVWDIEGVIKVSIGQFYGIEINDYAVTVAKTALWIAESQMMKETEEIVKMDLDFLPLKSYANIVEANALRIDWESVCPKEKLSYIMGNPPFVGYKLQTEAQKAELTPLYNDIKNIDYVAGWYFKAAKLIADTKIKVAFVSTNSITQGEQVSAVWKPLYDRFNIHIDFAHRTFRWDSEASSKAHVHCVIVGFSYYPNTKQKKLYSSERVQLVDNINFYLVNAENIFIDKRSKPICDSEKMIYGSEPREGGFLLLTEEEKTELCNETPESIQYVKRFVSADDYLNNKSRYCLWLDKADVSIMRKSKIIMERLRKCKEFRENSKQKQAHEAAQTPGLFASPRQPNSDYLLIPIVSSENRKYIPIGYVSKDVIASNACFTLANASLYTFGILTSNVHMAWMRAVCGRLEMRYRYSNTIVYNNFPWCEPTEEQKARIEQTAQAILDARALYPDCSLADLYDEITMPIELRKAHQANDKAVMQAYGFWGKINTESECVAELMKMYQKIVKYKNNDI